jgi:hypothetical protein
MAKTGQVADYRPAMSDEAVKLRTGKTDVERERAAWKRALTKLAAGME